MGNCGSSPKADEGLEKRFESVVPSSNGTDRKTASPVTTEPEKPKPAKRKTPPAPPAPTAPTAEKESADKEKPKKSIPVKSKSLVIISSSTQAEGEQSGGTPERSIQDSVDSNLYVLEKSRVLMNGGGKASASGERQTSSLDNRSIGHLDEAQQGDGVPDEITETSTLKKVLVSGKMMLNQYMVIKTLGKGNFGTVRLCFNLNDKKLYAIKTLNKKALTRNRGLRKKKDADPLADLKREVAIMKKLRHPNLVKLYEVIDDPVSTKMLMVMEHVQGGPIRSDNPKSSAPSVMSEQVVVHYFRDMCMGLDYLHFNHIVHADLKPDNMLLSAGGEVKITDFGCSRVLDEEGLVSSKSTGTPVFHAPEMTTGQPYIAYGADIWALGVTLYVFIFGVMPFKGDNITELHHNIANQELTFPKSQYVSDELKDLLTAMLEKDPDTRIGLPDVMAHSWVTQGGMASINSLQHLQNPPPLVSVLSSAEEDNAIRSDTAVALMQPCFEEVTFKNGEHLIRAGDNHDVVFYLSSGQCEVVQMVSSMRVQDPDVKNSGTLDSGSLDNTTESTMFSQDDWSCFDVANPNSSMVDNMYQSLDNMQVVHFEHVVRTIACGSFVGNVEQLDLMEHFGDNVSVIAKGTVTALAIQKEDLVQFLASRPEVEKLIRGRMAQAKTDQLMYKTMKQMSKDIGRSMKSFGP